MTTSQHLEVLQMILTKLEDRPINWAVTGSLGMALQGVPVEVHDIDIQTDKDGAYEIERYLAEFVIKPVHYRESERIRSHFGVLQINDVKVEVMGAVQKRIDFQVWEEPVQIESYRRWVAIADMLVPVLSLEYEYQAYLRLGRNDKVEILRAWLQSSRKGPTHIGR